MSEYHGSKTLSDGRRVGMSAEEAKDMWDMVQKAQKDRAEKLPDSMSCLGAISQAKHRLNELGWREGVYCPRDGSTFAVAQVGSTGMWAGFWMESDRIHGLIIAADCAMTPKETFWKSIDKLTDEERAIMLKCDADNAAWTERVAKSLSFEE